MLETALMREASFRFTARISIARSQDDGEPGSELVTGQKLDIKVVRPASIRIEDVTSRSDIDFKTGFMANPFGLFVSDGKTQCELQTVSHVYEQSLAKPRLETMRSKHGLLELIAPDVLFAESPLQDIEFIGHQNIDGLPMSIYERRQTFHNRLCFQRLYVSDLNRLPFRLSILSSSDRGPMLELQRTDFSEWNFTPNISAVSFDTAPPKDSRPVPAPAALSSRLARIGAERIPFIATGLFGEKVELDQYQGSVVLLNYWALWCVPCRKEIFNIKAAYEQLQPYGFNVIGINLDPYPSRVQDFIIRNEMPWPQICEGKVFDSSIVKAYEVAEIPFNLLIGRDGKIVSVGLGADELVMEIRNALGKTISE